MSVDLSPIFGAALGAIGGLTIALTALLIRRRENEERYQACISIGAFFILVSFLFQALPYAVEEKNRLVAQWLIAVITLIYVAFVIWWYKWRRPKKHSPKSAGKSK